VLAAFLLAFAVFEAVKHGGPVLPLAVLGAVPPLLGAAAARATGRAARSAAAVLGHWVPPAAVLVAFTVLPENQRQAAPGFTLGLVWAAGTVLAGLRPARADDGAGPPRAGPPVPGPGPAGE
jgi:hypothetical protein